MLWSNSSGRMLFGSPTHRNWLGDFEAGREEEGKRTVKFCAAKQQVLPVVHSRELTPSTGRLVWTLEL